MSYPTNHPPQGPYPVPYAAPPMYVQAPPRGMSITSMVLGLVSLLLGWTFLVPVIGLIFGLVGIKKERAGIVGTAATSTSM